MQETPHMKWIGDKHFQKVSFWKMYFHTLSTMKSIQFQFSVLYWHECDKDNIAKVSSNNEIKKKKKKVQ